MTVPTQEISQTPRFLPVSGFRREMSLVQTLLEEDVDIPAAEPRISHLDMLTLLGGLLFIKVDQLSHCTWNLNKCLTVLSILYLY